MLQGCVPVVTDCAALPEVAGDTGIYAKYGDVDSTVRAIQQALATPSDYGLRARERILSEFPLEKRRQNLLEAIQTVCMAK
jgi:glycosyltransferase involved in cell wall biosynthesis